MRLVIMGAPGAGKGTMATAIKNIYHIPHISTGDMFREAIKNLTPLGKIAKEYLDKGELVPDTITIGLVAARLQEEDCKNGFLFDGFPRTIKQASALDEILNKMNIKLNGVLDVRLDQDFLIKRLSGRRVCPNCGASYHLVNLKPRVDGYCDVCNTKLSQRPDDNEETIRHRLSVYETNTLPLLVFYEAKGLVVAVEGHGDARENFLKIAEKLEGR